MEIGAFNFADVVPGDLSHPARRIPELVEEIELAEQVGLDVYGIGEHHHPAFAGPAPAVILAAGAARTNRIRLTSAVTVLSADDPVRVFEQFTALDLVSSGRAEIMAGRGAFLDGFRLFGHEVQNYDDLFDEKIRLLLQLRTGNRVSWEGRFRAPLNEELILPRPVQDVLPVRVAVGGSPQSVVRAAELGLPLVIGTIGGLAAQFAPLADLYREALVRYQQPAQPIAVTLHGFVADTSQHAADTYYRAESAMLNIVAAERGFAKVTPEQLAARDAPGSMHAVGSPEKVVEKLLNHHEVFGHQRTMLQLAVGPLDHLEVMHAIELLGTRVAPAVREEIDRRSQPAPAGP